MDNVNSTCLLRIIPVDRVVRFCVERSPIPHTDVFAIRACAVTDAIVYVLALVSIYRNRQHAGNTAD